MFGFIDFARTVLRLHNILYSNFTVCFLQTENSINVIIAE